MERNYSLEVFCIILIVLLITLPLFPKTDSTRTKYNFLLITIDTLRPDRLSCYSREHLKTPHIDSLAEKGVLFKKAFAHTPTTLPSHTNILLGTTPLYHGVHDNSNFIVNEEFLTLTELLKNYDYSTGAFIGAFPLDSRFGLTQGFDVYDDYYGGISSQEFTYVERKAEVVVDKAMDWLKNQRDPWFLWVHCFDPHQRYDPPEPYRSLYKKDPYSGEVAYVDFVLGRLFDYLEKNGLFENTLIIFTGDHGEALGQHGEPTHGYFAYNATLWIPLIIYFPGGQPGEVNHEVCHTDIFPTVCDTLGIEKPSFLQGVSLMSAAKGKKLPKRVIYFESLYPFYSRGWAPLIGFIEGSQKFFDSPIPELFDLEQDFDELENLAPQKKLGKYKAKLEKIIKQQSYAGKTAGRQKIDREALEKLRSLGYVSNPQVSRKQSFSQKDDLKTLLPYQVKLMNSMKAYHGGDIMTGVRLLSEVIEERKDFDQAYSYLATLYKELGKLEEAIKTLKEGLENNPSSNKLISSYGIFLIEVGEYDAAVEILKKGLDCIDYDPELWNYLGVAYWSKGDFQNAVEAYQKALILDNNYPIVFNNLGSLYLSKALKSKKAGDLKSAIHNFQKAIELDPGYSSAYNGLGSAYGETGDMDAAINCWEKAVELNSDYSFPLYNLGLAYLAKGNKSKALEFLKRYKTASYTRISEKEKEKLNSLIQQCQQK
ncbi:MAG: sulfatase-like hydrolase/transferase [Candidatus Aminicenantes bacterium]|nr:sulfatase-like hydrolase/transferase [Candidatus Aminicenantes bacterium]